MTHSQVPDFDTIAEALDRARAAAEPAETHGQLCGLACVLGADAGPPWLADVLAEANEADSARRPAEDLLSGLARHTWTALDEGDMSFTPLLPDDDHDIGLRAESLGRWCQGFLYGLAAVAGDRGLLSEGSTGEILRDFVKIAQAGIAGDEAGDDAERAYAELVEFVRVGAQLVFEELRGRRAAAGHRPH